MRIRKKLRKIEKKTTYIEIERKELEEIIKKYLIEQDESLNGRIDKIYFVVLPHNETSLHNINGWSLDHIEIDLIDT